MLSEQQQRIMGYFIEEAKDHLNTIEQGLLNLQATIADPEMVSEVFRAAHSVKGGAAMLGLDSIQQTAHRLEDFFKLLKECSVRVDQTLETLSLRVFDTLQELLEQLQGPFGLTDDKANEIMAAVEPVFAELNQHLSELAKQSGNVPPEAVELTPQPVFTPARVQPVNREESALRLVFQSDVPARLREMLQLFKQPDTADSRQHLQENCRSLAQMGEQFDLSSWNDLLEMAQLTVTNLDNTYRTLAPVLIKDIKQAYEFVLAGRSSEVAASEDLKSLLPALPVAVLEMDFADLLEADSLATETDASQLFDLAASFDLEPALEFDDSEFDESLVNSDDDWFTDTSLEVESARDPLAVDRADLPGAAADELNFDYSLSQGTSNSAGPEVGIAELNSLADLFEQEAPDLDIAWQEEMLDDAGDDLSDSLELDSASDFSDLLSENANLAIDADDSDDDLSGLLNRSELADRFEPLAKPVSTSASDLSDLLNSDFLNAAVSPDENDIDFSDFAFTDAVPNLSTNTEEPIGSSDDLSNLSELFNNLDEGLAEEELVVSPFDSSVSDTSDLDDLSGLFDPGLSEPNDLEPDNLFDSSETFETTLTPAAPEAIDASDASSTDADSTPLINNSQTWKDQDVLGDLWGETSETGSDLDFSLGELSEDPLALDPFTAIELPLETESAESEEFDFSLDQLLDQPGRSSEGTLDQINSPASEPASELSWLAAEPETADESSRPIAWDEMDLFGDPATDLDDRATEDLRLFGDIVDAAELEEIAVDLDLGDLGDLFEESEAPESAGNGASSSERDLELASSEVASTSDADGFDAAFDDLFAEPESSEEVNGSSWIELQAEAASPNLFEEGSNESFFVLDAAGETESLDFLLTNLDTSESTEDLDFSLADLNTAGEAEDLGFSPANLDTSENTEDLDFSLAGLDISEEAPDSLDFSLDLEDVNAEVSPESADTQAEAIDDFDFLLETASGTVDLAENSDESEFDASLLDFDAIVLNRSTPSAEVELLDLDSDFNELGNATDTELFTTDDAAIDGQSPVGDHRDAGSALSDAEAAMAANEELEELNAFLNEELSEDSLFGAAPAIITAQELDGFDDLDLLFAENPDDNASEAELTTASEIGDFDDFDDLLGINEEAFLTQSDDRSAVPDSEVLDVDLEDFSGFLSDGFAFPETDVQIDPAIDDFDFDLADALSANEVSADEILMDDPFSADAPLANDDRYALDAQLPEESTPAAPPSDFSELDDFADLEALLDEESISSISGFNESDPSDFADLEGLSDNELSGSRLATSPSAAEEFDDLEKLLENADQTLGGTATNRGVRRPSLTPKKRSPGVLNDQTMRVSVKNLDNLNNLVGELVVNRNSLEQAQERLRQFLDNLLYQVQQLSDVGQRMRDLYERSLLESSLLSSRRSYHLSSQSSGSTLSQGNHATGMSFDALEMDRFTGFHTLSQEMIELIVRVRESASDIDFVVDESDQVTRMFRQVTTQLQEGLNRSRMVPFDQTAARLPRAVRDISVKCGKQAELVVEGKDTLIDKMILEQLYDPMTHLVNNAITHGVETPEERRIAGKPPMGRIMIRAFHQGNQTVISVSDDGAGIDPEIVKRKAIEKRLITATEARSMTRLDFYDLLFHHGFSTRDKADDFAGRGVGMDVVRTSLNEIRGSINIDSTVGRGTTFTIRLPLTLSISKALCCISNRARIAFPMDGVEDMLDVPKEQVQIDAEGNSCIQWRDTLLPFQPLSQLLRYSRSLGRGSVYGGNQEDDIISVVVLRSNAGSYLAIQLDQVLGEQEIVIKQLEGPVPKPIGVAGATVLGDGYIMPIADVLELIDLSMGRIRREPNSSLWEKNEDQNPIEPLATKTDPTVLIVDDSITVRELLSMTFSKIGYRVEQARDGQEAWEKLRAGLPCDLVFCDIEMPRMDGLELLSRIQKDANLNHLPIAMLTSRGADRHRQMAVQLGARGYFTKPYLEEALLDAAQRMLKGEVLVGG